MRDEHPLPDIQSTKDRRGIPLQLAGIRGLRLPLNLEIRPNEQRQVDATISLAVNVPELDRGTHMSRLVEVWTRYCDPLHRRAGVIKHSLRNVLQETCDALKIQSAYCELGFVHYLTRFAPVTGLAAPLAIDCSYQASLEVADPDAAEDNNRYQQIVSVEIPISTLCPCSKAISKNGAHNQRAKLRASVVLREVDDSNSLPLDELIEKLEDCASCPVYTMLKRPDEKYVTEKQYENAKFVEDVVRDAITLLRSLPQVKGFAVKVEALESIHAHNAWAAHQENFTQLSQN